MEWMLLESGYSSCGYAACVVIIRPHRRHWWVLYEGRVASAGQSLVDGQVDWVNKKLAAKMARQMQDPLTIASGSVPEWCAALCRACGFLLPLDTRTLHFQTSGFGIARALTNLQVWGGHF